MANEQGLDKMMLSSASSHSVLCSVHFGFGLNSLVLAYVHVRVRIGCWCVLACVGHVYNNERENGIENVFCAQRTQKTKINKLHSTLNRSIFPHRNSHDDLCNVHDDCAQNFCPLYFLFFFAFGMMLL